MDIQTQIKNLMNITDSLIKRINGLAFYTDADINGCRRTAVKQNNNISENDASICEVAELEDSDSQAIDELAEIIDTNSSAIDDLAELVDKLLQEVNELKGGK